METEVIAQAGWLGAFVTIGLGLLRLGEAWVVHRSQRRNGGSDHALLQQLVHDMREVRADQERLADRTERIEVAANDAQSAAKTAVDLLELQIKEGRSP